MPEIATSQQVKSCCAAAYGSDWARLLIGDSMHPGGSELTVRLGASLGLGPESRVLDVAAGRGASALTLAQSFGCEVAGIDLSADCMQAALIHSTESGLTGRLTFALGDAEFLPYDDAVFDAVVCECAYCTFPDKALAAREMARVLKPGGKLGLSDLVRRGDLPPELQTLAGWVACVTDARPESEYIAYLESAGLRNLKTESQDAELIRLVEQIRGRLQGVRLLGALGKIALAGVDIDQVLVTARAADAAVRRGVLGYTLLTAIKP